MTIMCMQLLYVLYVYSFMLAPQCSTFTWKIVRMYPCIDSLTTVVDIRTVFTHLSAYQLYHNNYIH